jgi:Uma2 family endonuclease
MPGLCRPFDVRLPQGDEKDEEVINVVQPDLSIICDQDKLDERGCKGAPTVVIEIISPSTARRSLKRSSISMSEAGFPNTGWCSPHSMLLWYTAWMMRANTKRPRLFHGQVLTSDLFPGLAIKWRRSLYRP